MALFLACLAATIGAHYVGAAAQTVTVMVNGRTLPQSAVEVQRETVYVALRPVAQAFGADIATNARAKTVTVTTLLRQVVLHLDDRWATVNGQRVLLSEPARQSGSRIVLPLRALGDAFGATVLYDAKTHSARVTALLHSTPSGSHTPPPIAAGRTLSGTVLSVFATTNPATLLVHSGDANYTITVPAGTSIAFRDIHGAVTGNGVLEQVRPGDALVVTLDAGGHLISMADIFASINGTIAAVADQSMVLASGRVITADPSFVTVTLDGKAATFAALRPGDKVSVRADPVNGIVRDVVALRPGGFATSAVSTPAPGNQNAGAAVQIRNVRDNAAAAFRAGQVLTVAADGTPGASATFNLSNVIVDNPMRETRSGHYEGRFEVVVGTNLTDAPILVRMTKNGETAIAEAPDPLTIVTTPPTVKDAAPAAGARINAARPSIFATFLTVGNSGMNADSLQMRLNGRDVTSEATRTGTFISYYPPADLSSRSVEVEVKGTDIAGNPLDYTWTFSIEGK